MLIGNAKRSFFGNIPAVVINIYTGGASNPVENTVRFQRAMFERSASYGLVWDYTASDVDRSRQWVLCAMQKYGRDLVTMLWRILGNDQDVCDAYQNTFLQLAHVQSTLRPAGIKAYVFRTAGNVAITMLRRRTAERKGLAAVADQAGALWNVGDGIAADGGPDCDIDARQMKECLRCCIAKLPDNLRDVIVLRDLGDLSYDQVAKIVGITPATARVYRCKAVRLLAAWMKK